MKLPPGLPNPSTITFSPVTLYYKHNHKDFCSENFQTMAKISNLEHFWNIYNTLDFELYLQQGSFFLCCGESPMWVEEGGTYSFIVGIQTKENHTDKLSHTPWVDLSLALICFLLNSDNASKIEGVSITKKRKAFNCKLATQYGENQQSFIEQFLADLPGYFGNSKFMKNNQRKVQFTKPNVEAATYIPFHMRCGKPPMVPKKKK
jgi:hypothetical protein